MKSIGQDAPHHANVIYFLFLFIFSWAPYTPSFFSNILHWLYLRLSTHAKYEEKYGSVLYKYLKIKQTRLLLLGLRCITINLKSLLGVGPHCEGQISIGCVGVGCPISESFLGKYNT
jgi:hypothetical protein